MQKMINKIIIGLLIILVINLTITFLSMKNVDIKQINEQKIIRFYKRYEINKFIELSYDTEMINYIYDIYNNNIKNYNITKKIIDECIKENIPINVIIAIVWVESNFKPYAINYNKNSYDIGLFQLNTNVYKKYNYYDLYDINLNIKLGIKHFKEELEFFNKNIELAILSYNCGRNRILNDKLGKKNIEYLRKVLEMENYLDFLFNDLINKIED